VDNDGVNINTFVDSWDDGSGPISGTILVRDILTPTIYAEYDVTGAVVSASTYSKVAVTHVVSSGTFVDGKTMDVRFVRSGLIGSGGPPGSTGTTGARGIDAGLDMTFESTTTDTDQGVGKVWFNNGTLSSATVMYMDDVDANSANINSYMDSWDDSTHTALRGTVKITQKASAAIFAIYNVTGSVTSASTYSKVAVTYVTGAGSFTDADASTVVFVRTGNTGGGLDSLSADSSPQLGGFLDPNDHFIGMQKGGDIASASPLVIDTDGDYFVVSGTTNFSAMTVAADRHFFLEFAAILTITHGGGTIDIPGAANYTSVASDVIECVSTAANVVTIVGMELVSGKAQVESVTLANSVTLTNKTLGAFTLSGAVTGGDQTITAVNLKDYGEVTNALGDLGGGTDAIDLTAGNSVSALVSTGTQTFTFTNPTATDEGCGFTLVAGISRLARRNCSNINNIRSRYFNILDNRWRYYMAWYGGFFGEWLMPNPRRMMMAAAGGAGVVDAGNLWAWGVGSNGKLGDGTTVNKSSPVHIGGLTDWATVSAGGYHSTAIKTDGTLWAWGQNHLGMLGDGTTVNKSSPVQIGSLTNWARVSRGRTHTAAIKTDGTLWAWGSGALGVLGDGSTTNRSSPVQIGSLTTWARVSGGRHHSTAVKTDGTLWAWGGNLYGALGDGTTTHISSPVQVGSLTTWATVSAGEWHTSAVKTDGTLWAWGWNLKGQIGNGSTTHISSPVQIGGLTNWATVSAGRYHSTAIKTDGTLWIWGNGYHGRLGDGTTVDKSSPIQIGALTNWATVATGLTHTTTVKTDGTLWAWGSGSNGQLGDGTTVNKSSPVQIGSLTTWARVSARSYHVLALKVV